MSLDPYWQHIDSQLRKAAECDTGAKVIELFPTESGVGEGWYGGGDGGDLYDVLMSNGTHWYPVWWKAQYYWQIRSNVDESTITYVEGDLYLNDGMKGPM